jgi:amino acid transporter
LAFANKATTSAAASPFVTAIIESGIPVLPGFLNGCILLFVFSAANSDLYISSRTLYGLAKEGNAPAMFAKTNERGIPVNSLAVSGLLACLAFMNVSDDSKTIFGYFSNLTTIFGILTWISILVAHIYFVRAREAQGIYKRDMVYTAPLGVYGTWVALGMCIVITIFKNFDVFVHDSTRKHSPNFDYTTFITAYLGIPLYLGLIFGYKFVRRSRAADPRDVDLHTGKAEIDKMEEEFLAKQRAVSETKKKANRLYDHFVGWLL